MGKEVELNETSQHKFQGLEATEAQIALATEVWGNMHGGKRDERKKRKMLKKKVRHIAQVPVNFSSGK